MAGGDHGNVRRRSQRLIKMKEEAGASEEEWILKLKRDLDVLLDRRYSHLRKPAQADAATPSPCKPSQSLPDGAAPPPCDLLAAERAGKKRKVIKTRLPEGLIEYYILYPYKAYNGFPEEKLGKCPLEFRERYAESKAIEDKTMEYRHALIKQFRCKGFAIDYTEVFTDDEEGKDEECNDE